MSKFDMRYSSERQAAEHHKRYNKDEGPPPMYRADLFFKARNLSKTAHEFRNIAATTGLSVNTIRLAIDGNAAKLDTLWILAKFFEIDWLQLFDVDRRLEFIDNRPAIAVKPKTVTRKIGRLEKLKR